jgi:hypothetical protein
MTSRIPVAWLALVIVACNAITTNHRDNVEGVSIGRVAAAAPATQDKVDDTVKKQ